MSLAEHIDFEVRESPINGKGIFAKRLIKSGEIVFVWHPKTLTKEESSKLSKTELKHYTYPDGDKILWMQPPERYINHSCDANTVVIGKSDVASRDIRAGDEITSDYIDIETEDLFVAVELRSAGAGVELSNAAN
jgi:SET domain-containing protein